MYNPRLRPMLHDLPQDATLLDSIVRFRGARIAHNPFHDVVRRCVDRPARLDAASVDFDCTLSETVLDGYAQ